MPQLDGPLLFVEEEDLYKSLFKETATMPRGGYSDESDSDSHDNRSHNE